jgi:hypothetical protein
MARDVHSAKCRFEARSETASWTVGRAVKILFTEDIMKATNKAKSAKKSVMHKGKSLEAVKPLSKIAAGANTSTTPTESVSFPYTKIEWTYKS